MRTRIILSQVTKRIAVTYKVTDTSNYQLHYANYSDNDLKNNLVMVDSLLPDMLAEILLYYHGHSEVSMSNVLARLIAENPMCYDQSFGHNFYERKIKSFLSRLVLGFPNSSNYMYRINCDVISQTGNSIYNPNYPNKFEGYLLDAAKIAISKKHLPNDIFIENGDLFTTLAVEFRFD